MNDPYTRGRNPYLTLSRTPSPSPAPTGRARQGRHSLSWLANTFALRTLLKSPRSVHILIVNRFLRMFAYGGVTLIIALHFAELGFSDAAIGLFLTLTLVGEVAMSLVLAPFSDGFGRRRALLLEAWLMVGSGIVFGLSGNYYLLLTAAIMSPNGNKIGPFRAVEESALAQLSTLKARSDVYAWYMLATSLSIAFGNFCCGWAVNRFKTVPSWTVTQAYQTAFFGYALVGLGKVVLVWQLTEECEIVPEGKKLVQGDHDGEEASDEEVVGLLSAESHSVERFTATMAVVEPRKPLLSTISRKSRVILVKICLLFAVDMLASGLTPGSLINFYVKRKFNPDIAVLGSALTVAWCISAVSNLFSSAIAKRIGYIRTMAFTHLPGSVILGLLPLAGTFPVMVVMMFLRASVDSMDMAPKSAFLSSVVLPSERTAVMGITNIVKTLAQTIGPSITGVLAGNDRFWVAFVLAGTLKVSYDLGLLVMFRKTVTMDGRERIEVEGHGEHESLAAPDTEPH